MKKIPETHLKYDPETGNIFNGTTILANIGDDDQTFVCRNEITADDVTVGDIRAMISWRPPAVISEKAHEAIGAALKQVEGFDASTYPYAEEQKDVKALSKEERLKVAMDAMAGKNQKPPLVEYFNTKDHIKKTVGADAEIDRLNELLAAAQNRIKELEEFLGQGRPPLPEPGLGVGRTTYSTEAAAMLKKQEEGREAAKEALAQKFYGTGLKEHQMGHQKVRVGHQTSEVGHQKVRMGHQNPKHKGMVKINHIKYGSIREASEKTGIPKSTISRRIKKNLPGYGYL